MLTIEDYNKPTSHPFGMLRDIRHASEKEGFMWWFLGRCFEENNLDAAIKTKANEDYMCNDDIGLLEKVGEQTYKLTRKAKALLWIHYGKD